MKKKSAKSKTVAIPAARDSVQRMVSLSPRLRAWLSIWYEYEQLKKDALTRQDFEEADANIKRRNEYANVICKELHGQTIGKVSGDGK